jgi:hypothetical protein
MTSGSIPEYPENANSINSTEPKTIEDIIAELRITIDQLDIHFVKAKNLILELAKELDETKQCKQSQICRKIKDILEDKIKESKISEKWIEECLPHEYKRKYTNKSELSSLSKQGNLTTEQEKEKDLITIIDSGSRSSIKIDGTWPNNYGVEDIASAANPQLQEESNEKGATTNQIVEAEADLKLKALISECNNELREAVKRQTAIKTVDQISATEIQFTIPKEKYSELKAAMDNSTNSVYVIFNKSCILERAEPDTFREELRNG